MQKKSHDKQEYLYLLEMNEGTTLTKLNGKFQLNSLSTFLIILLSFVTASVSFMFFTSASIPHLYEVTTTSYKGPYVEFNLWERSFPCVDKPEKLYKDNQAGLFYLKIHKASSSTLSGINEHIARRHKKKRMSKKCYAESHHTAAGKLNYGNRDKKKSFLWTFIRDPKDRKLSSFFYFNVTRNGVNPTGPTILKDMKMNNNYQYYYMLTEPQKVNSVDDAIMTVLNEYNFVGLTERFDESLVLLRLILGLDPEDILYVPSKVSGSFARQKDECLYIQKKFTTAAVDEYLESDKWYETNKIDYALYDAVNRSIDATIRMIGEKNFLKALNHHKKLLETAKDKCLPETVFPCNREGEVQKNTNCYWYDIGCGYDCVDNLFDNK